MTVRPPHRHTRALALAQTHTFSTLQELLSLFAEPMPPLLGSDMLEEINAARAADAVGGKPNADAKRGGRAKEVGVAAPTEVSAASM